MTVYEIPLTPQPQNFQIVLGGKNYGVKLRWCDPAQAWVMDFATDTGVPILEGVPLIANTDLLEPYAYLDFGGALTATTKNAPYANPTFTNLGTASNVYFTTP